MAKVAPFASRLRDGLVEGLRIAGIEARVDIERIHGTRLHRVFVVADAFAKLRPSERQDLVWRIADQALTPEERLQISMIFTVTKDELLER
jgi:hypothetical protein